MTRTIKYHVYTYLDTTIVALVRNEHKHCKTIVDAGFHFNVSSLVQAIGRLRPNQRGSRSVVKVFCSSFRKIHLDNAKQEEVVRFNELCAAGCLDDQVTDEYKKIFSPCGLQKLLTKKERCYLAQLSM